MDRAALPRLLAALFVLLAIVVAVIELGRDGEQAVTLPPPDRPALDPLQGELQRCQELGEAALHDHACLAVWAENRRRFLGGDPAPEGDE